MYVADVWYTLIVRTDGAPTKGSVAVTRRLASI